MDNLSENILISIFQYISDVDLICIVAKVSERWHNLIYSTPVITRRFPLKIEIDSLFGNSVEFSLASLIDKRSLKVSKIEISEDLKKYSHVKAKPSMGSLKVHENLRNILTYLSDTVLHLKVKEIHENLLEIIFKQLPNLTHLEIEKINFENFEINEKVMSRIKSIKIDSCEWNSTKISPFELLNLKKLEVIESRNFLIRLKTSKLSELKLYIDLGVTDCSEIIKIIKSNKENLRKVSIKKCSNSELLSCVWNETKLEKLSVEFSGLLEDCEVEECQKELKSLMIFGSVVNAKVLRKIMRKSEALHTISLPEWTTSNNGKLLGFFYGMQSECPSLKIVQIGDETHNIGFSDFEMKSSMEDNLNHGEI